MQGTCLWGASQLMELTVLYWTYMGGGGHEILTIIPYFLELADHDFGLAIEELDVHIDFIYPFKPGMNLAQWTRFNDGLPEQPTIRVLKKTRKIRLQYVSKFAPPYYDGFGRTELTADGVMACALFEQYLREFCETLESIAPKLSRTKGFHIFDLIGLIKSKLQNPPKKDGEIIELIAGEKRQRALPKTKAAPMEPCQGKKLPAKIPVARFPGGSEYIGRWGDGKQFWAQVVASFSKPDDEQSVDTSSEENWRKKKRWYAILHTFDESGNHLETEYEYMGTTADGETQVCEAASAKMESFISKLGPVKYGNIAIKLFQVSIDENLFGMVDSSSEEFGDSTTMEPNGLCFHAPWNGNYDS